MCWSLCAALSLYLSVCVLRGGSGASGGWHAAEPGLRLLLLCLQLRRPDAQEIFSTIQEISRASGSRADPRAANDKKETHRTLGFWDGRIKPGPPKLNPKPK